MTQNKKIAVIGLGNIGSALADNFIKGNREFLVADRNIEKAKTFAEKAGGLAHALDIRSAIKEADIIIPAIWFSALKTFLPEYTQELQGKIIVDPSNPIAPDNKGGFTKIIGESESAGEILKGYLPENAKLVKALGTLGAGTLASAAFQKPEPAVLFYANDDLSINTAVDEMIRDLGYEPVRIGALDQSIRIEVFGDLHEFGALGKTVTAAEFTEHA